MTEFAGLFEVLAADQSDARLASRKALVLSRDRIDSRLGKFLGASRSPAEFDARFDLVAEDFVGIVRVAAREVGHADPDALVETLRDHYRTADTGTGLCKKCKNPYGKCKCDEFVGDDSKTAGKEHWIQDAVKKPGDLHKKLDVPEGEKIPESEIENAEETGGKDLKEKAQFAENVKGLGKGKKKSKKNKKKNKDNKPPWLKEDGDDGDDDDDDSLDFAAKTAAPAGNTGLAGPSPTMDKKRWTPKSITPIDVPSKRHPTVQKDITEVMPRENEGPPGDISNIDEINALTTTETLPTATGLDDAGFNGDKDTGSSGPTKTWCTDGREADPVGSASLEA